MLITFGHPCPIKSINNRGRLNVTMSGALYKTLSLKNGSFHVSKLLSYIYEKYSLTQ